MRHSVHRELRRLLAACLLTSLPALAAELTIAQVAPFSGPLTPTGTHLRAGAQLYFDAVNAAGGIHGNKLKLQSRDDGYKATETVKQVRELLREGQPLALFGIVGTGNVEAILKEKVLDEAGIPLVTVRTGASTVVKSGNPWLFATRASYAAEIDKIVQQYETIGYRRFAVFYQNDPFGLDGLASAEASIRKANGELVAKAGYEKNTTEVAAAVKAIVAAGPQAVIMVSNTAASAEFVRQSRAAGNLAQFVALSVTDGPQVAEKIGKEVAKGLAITQVVPDPSGRSVPLIREIQENFAKFRPQDVTLNHTLVEGYLGAKILGEGLRRAGPNPTRKKLRDALEQIRDYDVGGQYVSYSASNRVGTDYVDITILNKEGKLLR
ncbi:ABC transporter substrate-binding protein [Azospira restricta]|uniref:ABC transporter substrate-binding protein n=1 Tax=Azospira restricta TaxID=404405 RepID=A0A974PWH9_9RHOO|nr:ABC transporter substrate-binding protein [Azospira restricta]QRJ62556.1 ABC transporter substrate-binding protein [Azospira restricta]